jgi:deoxyribodipyrimidine photolyase
MDCWAATPPDRAHNSCLSASPSSTPAREVEHRLTGGAGAAAYRRQLCWREFYAHVIGHHPANARSEFQERYRGSIRWSRAKNRFEAWCEARTGARLCFVRHEERYV